MACYKKLREKEDGYEVEKSKCKREVFYAVEGGHGFVRMKIHYYYNIIIYGISKSCEKNAEMWGKMWKCWLWCNLSKNLVGVYISFFIHKRCRNFKVKILGWKKRINEYWIVLNLYRSFVISAVNSTLEKWNFLKIKFCKSNHYCTSFRSLS